MSQSQEILRLLSDGRWWSTAELLREVPCIVHSRIADIRAKGYAVEHRTTGKGAAGSEYRLAMHRVVATESSSRTSWPVGEAQSQAAGLGLPSGPPASDPEPVEARSTQLNLGLEAA